MNIISDWSAALSNVFSQMLERLVHYLPNIFGAGILLLIGWVAARLVRALAIRLARLLDRMTYRLTRGREAERPKMPSASERILGSIVFWVVILIFLVAASKVLGLDAFSSWLNRVVAYVPTLFAGGLIILGGFLLSRLARDLVVAAGAPAGWSLRAPLGRVVQITILATAVVIGADQIGIDVTFLVIMVAVVAGTLLGGIALAVSLGARALVSNLIGAHFLRQTYRLGHDIRISGHEGKIIDLTPTSVVLETDAGRVTLPAKVFSEEASVLLMGAASDE